MNKTVNNQITLTTITGRDSWIFVLINGLEISMDLGDITVILYSFINALKS